MNLAGLGLMLHNCIFAFNALDNWLCVLTESAYEDVGVQWRDVSSYIYLEEGLLPSFFFFLWCKRQCVWKVRNETKRMFEKFLLLAFFSFKSWWRWGMIWVGLIFFHLSLLHPTLSISLLIYPFLQYFLVQFDSNPTTNFLSDTN